MSCLINTLAFLLCFSVYAGDLNLTFDNRSSEKITVQYNNSNYVDKFKPFTIKPGQKIKRDFDFSDDYILNLNIFDEHDIYVTNFQIVNNHNYDNAYKNIVPGNGPLPHFSCTWNNSNRVIIKNIYGYKNRTWLLFNYYNGNIDVAITDLLPDKPVVSTYECPLKFTLFAVPETNEIKNIKLNTLFNKNLNLNKDKVSLDNWGIKNKETLAPAVYLNNKLQSRWVDLIIHNYSVNSYLLYGLDSKPGNDHISFDYKYLFNNNNIVFYPPRQQLKGPAFKFSVKTDGNKFTTFPQKNIPEENKDKYFLIIGNQTDMSTNILEYIPMTVKTDIEPGKAMNTGVNINAFKEHAYQAGFLPINVSFYLDLAKEENLENSIRIPLNENGNQAFRLIAMKDTKITAIPQSSGLKGPQSSKVGVIYEISGVSTITNTEFKFRLILIAPPFPAANTPGIYSPDTAIPSTSKAGNFNRYPLHLYVLPVSKNNTENEITSLNSKSELPDNMIGSIEYFISDDLSGETLYEK